MRKILLTLLGVVAVVGVYLYAMAAGLLGRFEGGGKVTPVARPEEVVREREASVLETAEAVGVDEPKRILFGDLHVHTTYSTDAFLWSLPMFQGEGPHPLADACDYARFCSSLDFWSINDHAEASTPRKWRETQDAIRQCAAVSGDARDPDVAVFLGWEWTQVGRYPDDHYGHKNVILKDLDPPGVPARPIGAAGVATDGLRRNEGRMPWITALADFRNRQRYLDFIAFMDEIREVPFCAEDVPSPELPVDCYEQARTPADLFRKLDEWDVPSLVIPHGNTWGFYTPPATSWDKQLTPEYVGADRQRLIEVMSGHGNSEEYRDWRAVDYGEDGAVSCPEPTPDYLPSCWRAGELALADCRDSGGEEAACLEKARETRQRTASLGMIGHLLVPGATVEDWKDSGQCRDCVLPSFNYRPGGSVQYGLALSNDVGEADPLRFRWGFIASSDTHRARPGTGYKEIDRLVNTDASGPKSEFWREQIDSVMGGVDAWKLDPSDRESVQDVIRKIGFGAFEAERQASFFTTGGLAAVHSEGRGREAIWSALERREVYGTTGDRILLWFDLLLGEGGTAPMGSELELGETPRFRVRAAGAFEQTPGCPEHVVAALPGERLERICRGECYNPRPERRKITRIEVVRIRPRVEAGEPVRPLIEDPWQSLECAEGSTGCVVEFEDPEYAAAGRDALYYVRAVQEPTPVINGGNLRCERGEDGSCVEMNPCYGDYRTATTDDCLAEVEERAWSSPIFLNVPE